MWWVHCRTCVWSHLVPDQQMLLSSASFLNPNPPSLTEITENRAGMTEKLFNTAWKHNSFIFHYQEKNATCTHTLDVCMLYIFCLCYISIRVYMWCITVSEDTNFLLKKCPPLSHNQSRSFRILNKLGVELINRKKNGTFDHFSSESAWYYNNLIHWNEPQTWS